MIDKIPLELRDDPDIIVALLNNKSIDIDMLHVYIRNLTITNVNQLMLIFRTFKDRSKSEKSR
jgi:hypothetical protein